MHIAVDQTAVRWAVVASLRNDAELKVVAETTEGEEGAKMGAEAFANVVILSTSRTSPYSNPSLGTGTLPPRAVSPFQRSNSYFCSSAVRSALRSEDLAL